MIRQLTPREKGIFIVTLIVVALSFFYNGFICPLDEKKDLLDQESVALQAELIRDLKVIKKGEALNAVYDDYLQQFRKSGSEEETESSLLSKIEKVAGQFGLHVMDLKPKESKSDSHSDQFLVSLMINSALEDVIRFLYVLQQSPYLFDVEEVEFEKLGRRNNDIITTRLVLGKAFISSDFAGEEEKNSDIGHE